MTITRLIGGLTPANGADPKTLPAIWNDTADQLEAYFSGIQTADNRLNGYSIDDLGNVTITGPVPNQILSRVANGWINRNYSTYNSVDIITASTTWYPPENLLSYPIKVVVMGGSGAGADRGISTATGLPRPGTNGGNGGDSYFTIYFSPPPPTPSPLTILGSGGVGGLSAGNLHMSSDYEGQRNLFPGIPQVNPGIQVYNDPTASSKGQDGKRGVTRRPYYISPAAYPGFTHMDIVIGASASTYFTFEAPASGVCIIEYNVG